MQCFLQNIQNKKLLKLLNASFNALYIQYESYKTEFDTQRRQVINDYSKVLDAGSLPYTVNAQKIFI